MFQSEFQHNIDSKGRLTLPARVREELGTHFVLTKGLDGCLYIYSGEGWEAFLVKMNQLPTSSKDARRLKRWFVGSSIEIEVDKQGRFIVPPVLRTFAKIEKNVTVLGVSDHIELWATEVYDAYQNEDEVSIEDIAAGLEF